MADKSKETIIFSCRTKLAALLPYAAAGLAVLCVCALIGIWQFGAAVCGILIIYGAAVTVPGRITLTSDCVRSGRDSVPLEEITEAVCIQSFAGKLFRYGTVIIHTPKRRLTFRGLPRAEALRDEICRQLDLYHFRQTCRQAELARSMMSESKD